MIRLIAIALLLSGCGMSDLPVRPDFHSLNEERFGFPHMDTTGIVDFVTTVDFGPNVQNPYNGSIWKNSHGDWVLSYRTTKKVDPLTRRVGELPSTNYPIHQAIFSPDFTLKQAAKLLVSDPNIEDIRIVSSKNNRTVLIGNTGESTSSKREMVILDAIENSAGLLSIQNTKRIKTSENKDEKNWVPFFHDDDLFLSYQMEKSHDVLSENEICSGTSCKFNGTFSLRSAGVAWKWGKIRGGSPAKPYNSPNFGLLYITFFHSVHKTDDGLTIYFMGAAAFKAEKPFRITRISKFPLIFQDLYKCPQIESLVLPNRWLVAFPTGLFIENKHGFVSLGVNDSCTKVFSVNLDELLANLDQIETEENM